MKMPRLKEKVEALTREFYALYLAFRDPRVPWHVKAVVSVVVGYALSPIDLIPDFIPVAGLFDDLIIIPLCVAFIVRMLPRDTFEDCRRRADSEMVSEKPKVVAAAAIVVLIRSAIALAVLRKTGGIPWTKKRRSL
jgi:uncharacterized membrane protein YkvA (DUF1232 family)